MASQQNHRQRYIIKEATISSDRTDTIRDVASYIAELNIYEDINKPYLTGKVAFMDDAGIFGNWVNFKGTETLTITIEGSDPDDPFEFSHSFLMESIDELIKVNEKTELYTINLIDKYTYFDSALKISKSYKGRLEDIVTAILVSELDKTVDQSYIGEQSVQDNIKVIIPYLSPIKACQWLINRATTVNGSPYYLYASLYDENIRIADFDTAYSETPFNADAPLLYSPAGTNSLVEQHPSYSSLAIKEVRFTDFQNTFRTINAGAIGSKLTVTDTSTGLDTFTHHKVRQTLTRLSDADVIPSDTEQNVFDDQQLIVDDDQNPIYIDDVDARIFSKMNSKGTYGQFSSYHEIEEPSDVGDILRNISIRTLLEKNMIEVYLPGGLILEGQVTVGDTVAIDFLNSNVDVENIDDTEKFDKEKSGNYLIYAVRHTFIGTEHDVTMSVTKINTRAPRATDAI